MPQVEARLVKVELDLVHNTWEYTMTKSGDSIPLSTLAITNLRGENLLELPTRVHSTMIDFLKSSRWKTW